MLNLFWVALGGACGSVSRYLISLLATSLFVRFPLGTLTVNVLGSLAAGLLLGLMLSQKALPEPLKLFLLTGFLGGFTTFSALSLETLRLWLSGLRGLALLNLGLNLGLSLLAAAGGYALSLVLTHKSV